jgi:hypothetical protein
MCTCSIEEAKHASSGWSEAELQRAIGMLREALELKRNRHVL